jgi:hypothetical protein
MNIFGLSVDWFVANVNGFSASLAAKTKNRLHSEGGRRKPDGDAWTFRHDRRMPRISLQPFLLLALSVSTDMKLFGYLLSVGHRGIIDH